MKRTFMTLYKQCKIFFVILFVGLFFCSSMFVSCKKEDPQNDPSHVQSSTDTGINSTTDPSSTNNGLQNGEMTEETPKKGMLSPLQGTVLLRNSLRNYPSTMGPPGYNSVWNDQEIFVSTGDAGFTKIALSQQNMVEVNSYFYHRTFLQASEEYFLCRDKTQVFCLSKTNSKEFWKRETSSYGQDYYFAVNTEAVIRMHFDSSLQKATVYGIHAKTGKTLWTLILEDKSHSFLGFSPYVLLFTQGTSLVGIHPSTGEKIWQHDSILELSDEPYQQEYFRNFRLLSDASIFVPIKENGEPFAYRIEPKTGKILTEYRLDSLQDVRFHNSYIETSSSILCSYRKGTQFFFIAYNKENGSIQWEVPFHQLLGDFAKQYGVECEYTAFENSPQKVFVEISHSTVLCLEIETGSILWSYQSEFSQIKSRWKDAFQIRLLESQEKQFSIEFLNLDTGSLVQSWDLPLSFQIPDAPISMIYSTDNYIIVRMNIKTTPYWLFFKPESKSIQYCGYLLDSQPNLQSTLVFFVTSKLDQLLFLVSGDNGYELEIVAIPDLVMNMKELNGDLKQARQNLRSIKYAEH